MAVGEDLLIWLFVVDRGRTQCIGTTFRTFKIEHISASLAVEVVARQRADLRVHDATNELRAIRRVRERAFT